MPTDDSVQQNPQSFRDEFRLKNFGLQHHTYEDFCRSQWQSNPTSVCFLAYRWVLAAFFGTGLCITFFGVGTHSGRILIYLTIWGFIMCSVTSIIGAILVTLFHFNPENFSSHSKLVQCYWACYWINLILSNIIGLVFWTAIYPRHKARITYADKMYLYYLFNISTHGMPSICFIVDHMLVAQPARLLHVVYPFGFALIYLGFSILYYLCGGLDLYNRKFIYARLNYSNPGEAATTVLGFIILLVFFSCLQYGVYRLRVFIARKLGKLI